jgi:hypothetical protein
MGGISVKAKPRWVEEMGRGKKGTIFLTINWLK